MLNNIIIWQDENWKLLTCNSTDGMIEAFCRKCATYHILVWKNENKNFQYKKCDECHNPMPEGIYDIAYTEAMIRKFK